MIFNVKKYHRLINWLLCIGIGSLFFIYFKFSRTQEFIKIPDDIVHLLFCIGLSILIFEVLQIINVKLNQLQNWENKLLLRLLSGFIFNYLTSVALIVSLAFLYSTLFISLSLNEFLQHYREELFKLLILGFFVLFIVSAVQLVFYQFKQQQFLQLQAESLKKKQLQLSIEAIHQQMSPHFLFNNLNTISSIILTQPNHITSYLRDFAGFYNNLIKYQSCPVISLSDELIILKQYHHLINTRFNQLITLDIFLSINPESYYLPPFTLQLLYENTIKHNLITPEYPMTISICDTKKDFFTFSNPLNPLIHKNENSGKGLKNIQERVKMIANKELRIIKTDTHFKIILPLIAQYQINKNINISPYLFLKPKNNNE